jgi:hypothetical protein
MEKDGHKIIWLEGEMEKENKIELMLDKLQKDV